MISKTENPKLDSINRPLQKCFEALSLFTLKASFIKKTRVLSNNKNTKKKLY